VDDTELDHQSMSIELCDGFTPHGQTRLATLPLADRQAQHEAHQVLFDYVDAMWDELKEAGLEPANDLRFAAVAGMRDLAGELVSSVVEAGIDDD
jgi:hypothetical protein